MKTLLAICCIAAATLSWAADPAPAAPAAASPVVGQVLEIKDVDSYTYLRLKTATGETWAAVNKVTVKKGATVTVDNPMVMNNFESKTLKKTFKSIVFGTVGSTGAVSTADKAAIANAHAGVASAPAPAVADIRVPKATGDNAQTVEDVVVKRVALKDKPVLVAGKVVKYNPGIMGKNWVHLRDGSGSAEAQTNDILVTTSSATKLGDTVTVKGIVRVDKDFGAGYAYKVLIEEATLQP